MTGEVVIAGHRVIAGSVAHDELQYALTYMPSKRADRWIRRAMKSPGYLGPVTPSDDHVTKEAP